MDKFIAWIEKNDIGTERHIATFGESYFYNVTPLLFKGELISWDICDRNTVTKWNQELRKIEKYASRYGYIIASRGGGLGHAYITVYKAEDAQQLRYYRQFSDRCIEEWEVMQHRYYRGDFPTWDNATFENMSRLLMNKRGEQYKVFLQNIKEANAA